MIGRLSQQVVSGPSLSAHRWLVLAMALVSWCAVGAGGLLLVRRYRDPALWLLLGTVAAGAGATVLTQANGQSQLYFLYSAFPLLGVLSAWGVTSAVADHGWPRRAWVAVAGGLLAGLVVVRTVAATVGADRPAVVGPPGMPRVALLAPWAVLVLVAVGVGGTSWAVWRRTARTADDQRRRVPGGRGVAVLGAALVIDTTKYLNHLIEVDTAARKIPAGDVAVLDQEHAIIRVQHHGADAVVALRGG